MRRSFRPFRVRPTDEPSPTRAVTARLRAGGRRAAKAFAVALLFGGTLLSGLPAAWQGGAASDAAPDAASDAMPHAAVGAWVALPGPAPALAADEQTLFVERLEKEVQRLAEELKRLEREARERGGEWTESAKEAWSERRERLRDLQAEAERMLKDARERTDTSWREARPHLEKSWEQFRDGVQKLLGG